MWCQPGTSKLDYCIMLLKYTPIVPERGRIFLQCDLVQDTWVTIMEVRYEIFIDRIKDQKYFESTNSTLTMYLVRI